MTVSRMTAAREKRPSEQYAALFYTCTWSLVVHIHMRTGQARTRTHPAWACSISDCGSWVLGPCLGCRPRRRRARAVPHHIGRARLFAGVTKEPQSDPRHRPENMRTTNSSSLTRVCSSSSRRPPGSVVWTAAGYSGSFQMLPKIFNVFRGKLVLFCQK